MFLFEDSQAGPIYPQEAKVNQRKINAERAKKEKESKKQYEKAVKQHQIRIRKDLLYLSFIKYK